MDLFWSTKSVKLFISNLFCVTAIEAITPCVPRTSIADYITVETPILSTEKLTPLPLVILFTSSIKSSLEILITCVAPNSFAVLNLRPWISTAITFVQPCAFANINAAELTAPVPNTTILSPTLGFKPFTIVQAPVKNPHPKGATNLKSISLSILTKFL